MHSQSRGWEQGASGIQGPGCSHLEHYSGLREAVGESLSYRQEATEKRSLGSALWPLLEYSNSFWGQEDRL